MNRDTEGRDMFGRTVQAACCAVLALGAGSTRGQATPVAPVKAVAVVNGESITTAQVDAEIRQSPMATPTSEAQQKLRRMEVLGLLIDNVLMKHFLDKATGPVSKEVLAKKLSDLEAGLARDGKSLAEFCQDSNQTLARLKASLADHLRWTAYAASQLTDQSLQQYYRDNKDFFDKVTVRASHIVLRVPAGAPPEEHDRARKRLEEMRAHLKTNPEQFAALAKEHSQDGNASQGGDLGWFSRKWAFDEEFAAAAFALRVGEISGVVKTEYGYHLIKTTERKNGTPTRFEDIKEAVRSFCSEDLRQKILARERQTAVAAGAIKINLP